MYYKNERDMKLVKDIDKTTSKKAEVTDKQAEEAFKTILAWIGENPSREGLLETPKRVVKAFKEYFKGYNQDATADLLKTFGDVEGYDDMVMLRNIRLESHCEHHLVPILGVAHIAYVPDRRVVGISKLARVLDGFSRRLQTQETLTAQVADCIQNVLQPKGVAVLIDAQHQCMTTRGVRKPDVSMITSRFTGIFKANELLSRRFLDQSKVS